MAEVVVLMSAALFSDLQGERLTRADAIEIASESKQRNARSNFDLATPNPEAGDSYFVTFFLDEQAGDFAESIKKFDGVLSVYVKPDIGLP
ncbi:hypothetical protein [Roseibium sp.]|uniref:hypothetical protein n=1 Tax=Roseibium sp. TaxID=1936156 RepID=UPI003BA9FAB4